MKETRTDVVFTQMKPKRMADWPDKSKRITIDTKRQLRNISLSAAAVFCLGIGTVKLMTGGERDAVAVARMTADFEYDETLGRLQFVSNILPESAMVFLEETEDTDAVFAPVRGASICHTWSAAEPWIEYTCQGDITACQDASVMTVIKNRKDEYTIRLMHEDGYESVYSGLKQVQLAENDRVLAGDTLGQAEGWAAFELRKDGLSVLPLFSE